MKTGQNIITRHLPKTGQVTSYAFGDDGDLERGWWKGRLNSNNRVRWITKTIGGDAIILDRATGLMWPKDFLGTGGNSGNTKTWADAIPWANGLSFAGFSDWRLPNIFEFFSLVVFNGSAPFIDTIFDNRASAEFWTGTTYPGDNSLAHTVNFSNTQAIYNLKILSFRVLACRKTSL